MSFAAQVLGFAAALAIGLLIGIERGWTLRSQKDGVRFAGVRTFTLLGLAGGAAGLAAGQGHEAVAAVVVAAAAIVVVRGYTDSATKGDGTSAVAALLAVALGFVAGSGNPALGVAGGALVTLILALREESHRFIGKLDEADVKALARFAVIALAVLPLLPNRAMGPFDAWNPQKLWLVVVIVTGFSFLGYIANRLFGERHGTIATALIGGAYSSTAVTASLAQKLGAETGEVGAEPAGIALASAVMYGRVVLLVGVLATALLAPFALLILPALVVGVAAGLFLLWRSGKGSGGTTQPGNPIAILPALGFLLFVALAAVAVSWAEGRFGAEGIAVLLLVTGSMDVDAAIVTAGGLKPGTIGPELAALALAGTVLINMSVKVGVTLAYARGRGSNAALALGASMVALAVSIAVGWTRL